MATTTRRQYTRDELKAIEQLVSDDPKKYITRPAPKPDEPRRGRFERPPGYQGRAGRDRDAETFEEGFMYELEQRKGTTELGGMPTEPMALPTKAPEHQPALSSQPQPPPQQQQQRATNNTDFFSAPAQKPPQPDFFGAAASAPPPQQQQQYHQPPLPPQQPAGGLDFFNQAQQQPPQQYQQPPQQYQQPPQQYQQSPQAHHQYGGGHAGGGGMSSSPQQFQSMYRTQEAPKHAAPPAHDPFAALATERPKTPPKGHHGHHSHAAPAPAPVSQPAAAAPPAKKPAANLDDIFA
uniref:Uncharacterized protein n=2 Tax=Neobodo designis TaxID=312471 RepID=A0A7S1L755_NEODS|mmetsp:Transcript_15821/g.49094  ORF Transcript_15821/g.49094 Transcript_15821/m.49094 type:complete len:293 (+) Transcript_15821:168-1046(+)